MRDFCCWHLFRSFLYLFVFFYCGLWPRMDKRSCKKSGYDWPRESTALLIQLYEQNRCLYVTTSADYHNRNMRQRALENIVREFNQKRLTNLTVEDIKKKIHGLRSQFLAEMGKIRRSETSGASTDTIYSPKLWCFEELLFLQQGAVISKGKSNLSSGIDNDPSEGIPESQDLEPEILFDGDVTQLSDADIFSPSTSRDPFQEDLRTPSREDSSTGPTQEGLTSRTPSRADSDTPLQQGGKTLKRKRGGKTGEPQANKEQLTNLLTSAVTTLKDINKPDEEVQPQLLKHRRFAEFIAEEMEALEDEEIIDDLKNKFLNLLYNAKKQQREKKNK